MPFLLYSYLATEILAPFFAGLIIINGVLLTGRLMQVIDLIFTLNIGLLDFFRLCAYLSTNLLLFSIPMASTMAVIIAFTKLSNDNEILALKAAGVNLYKMLTPVLLFAIFTTLATGFISTKLMPTSATAMKHLFIKLTTEKINKGIQEKRFSENTGNIILYVDEVNQQDQQWSGVYLSDLRDKKNPSTVLAQYGSLTPNLEKMLLTLDFTDGSLHRASNKITQTIKFDKYSINIPLKQPESIGTGTGVKKRKRLTQSELLESADQYGRDSDYGLNLLIEFHKRLALPVGCFMLSMLGVPLALRIKPEGRNLGVPLGLFFFILYYTSITAAKGMCYSLSLPVALIMWTPNLVFGLLTLSAILISAHEKWGTVVKLLNRSAKN